VHKLSFGSVWPCCRAGSGAVANGVAASLMGIQAANVVPSSRQRSLRPLAAIRTARARALRVDPPVAAPAVKRVKRIAHRSPLAATVAVPLTPLKSSRARRQLRPQDGPKPLGRVFALPFPGHAPLDSLALGTPRRVPAVLGFCTSEASSRRFVAIPTHGLRRFFPALLRADTRARRSRQRFTIRSRAALMTANDRMATAPSTFCPATWL
jgi:hypothetical protein